MAIDGQNIMEKQQPKLQIYPSPSNEISTFWREKYERDAKKYWDIFYKRHQDKFFKDRHYLDQEWGKYLSGAERKTILEVGCGAGNTIFPLIASYPDLFVHACDFSPRAVNLVKTHKEYSETHVNAFVCDLTADDLSKQIVPSSVDIVTMIFVLSAVSPEKMSLVLQNIRKILKPNGYVLFRDYATGDLAQERFSSKDQMISENFYVRGDGTRAFYFSDDFLKSLAKENGFEIEEHVLCCKQVQNRAKDLVMNRRWVQAVFRLHDDNNTFSCLETGGEVANKECIEDKIREITLQEPANDLEIDMSEGIAIEMYGSSTSIEEVINVELKDTTFKIKVLPKEHQHTCKSTGLMLWESAHLMASILASNPSIVAGKHVLELGCGCGGICSMVAATSADLVVATDGDPKALDLLGENIAANISPPHLQKLLTERLEWGNRDHIEAIKKLNHGGFEVIIGTDVTYVSEAILPLFATAKELISEGSGDGEGSKAGLILCHVFRRVDEPSILSAASQYGFCLVDKWSPGNERSSSGSSIIGNWITEDIYENVPTKALNIMYFEQVGEEQVSRS